MKLKTRFMTFLITTVLLITSASAQDLESVINNLFETNGQRYTSPLATALGTSLNSGTFRTAASHKLLGFDITVNVAAVAIPTQGKEFDFYIPADVTFPFSAPGYGTYDITFNGDLLYPGDRTSATFFGAEESNIISPDAGYASGAVASQLENQGVPSYVVDGLAGEINEFVNSELPINTPAGVLDTDFFPMVIPQISLGLPLDIELSLRGGLNQNIDELGEISLLGYGGKIGLNQFIPFDIGILPRLSAGYYQTDLSIGDLVDMKNTYAGIQASKRLLFLTLYGGYGIESSTMDVSYVNEETNTDVNFSVDGKNETRITAGLRLKLFFLSLNADYNVGEYDSYNLGLSFTFR